MSQEGNQIIVHGKVQMVGFRYATVQQALQLGLTGRAINLKNGDVEVQIFGDKTDRDKLILWLREGPEMAQVDALEISSVDYKKLAGFTQG
ncbi:acylphosphatase [Moritella sp. Urea-trap-13]|uniref:acylphosphatase n=1 Tax=Moritella sp. Urea-trap-13 TaxID=2058327 RepID=UPI000C344FF0|nr:acylphosphatase [Moritella sp. Urea-trap-13]PKH07005.1 acylphosphatase [Moritella sp. Urea-trap-13]